MCCSLGHYEQHGTIRNGEQDDGAIMGLIWDILFGLYNHSQYSLWSPFFVDWGCLDSVFSERTKVRSGVPYDVEAAEAADREYAAGFSKSGGVTIYRAYKEWCDDTRDEGDIVLPSDLQVVEYDVKLVEFNWERVTVISLEPLWGRELEVEMASGEGLIEEREGADGREFLWRRRDRAEGWD
jgi:hypothetical protein